MSINANISKENYWLIIILILITYFLDIICSIMFKYSCGAFDVSPNSQFSLSYINSKIYILSLI